MSPIFLLKNRILSLYDIIFVKNSNMDEQNNLKYLLYMTWHFAKPFVYIVMLYTLIVTIYDEWFRPTPQQHYESHWLNLDPTKSASDIAELDYENRLVRYREYHTEKDTDTTQQSIVPPANPNDGFNDWYDIDYYELYDYYHD
jgi:hypothetical protein